MYSELHVCMYVVHTKLCIIVKIFLSMRQPLTTTDSLLAVQDVLNVWL